jgi:hypothetical protein
MIVALCGLSAFFAHPICLLAARLARIVRRPRGSGPSGARHPPGGLGEDGAWEVAGRGVGAGRAVLVTVEVRGPRAKGRGR